MVKRETTHFLLIRITLYQLLGGFVSQRKMGMKDACISSQAVPLSNSQACNNAQDSYKTTKGILVCT